jgi:hypothetical protein
MRRRDRRQWQVARTVGELGELTARWLEGELASQPGYQAGCGPDEETRPLIPTLALINRAGLLTGCSQPGEEPGIGYDGLMWSQRAAVSGFTEPALAHRIATAAATAGLWVQTTTASGDHPTDRFVVTTRAEAPFTCFGGQRSRRDLAWHYEECSREASEAVCQAIQVTIVDPEWGRNNVLWPLLNNLAHATPTSIQQ